MNVHVIQGEDNLNGTPKERTTQKTTTETPVMVQSDTRLLTSKVDNVEVEVSLARLSNFHLASSLSHATIYYNRQGGWQIGALEIPKDSTFCMTFEKRGTQRQFWPLREKRQWEANISAPMQLIDLHCPQSWAPDTIWSWLLRPAPGKTLVSGQYIQCKKLPTGI
jgi:hypothetical protein